MLRAVSIAASLVIASTAGAQTRGFWLTGNAPDTGQGTVLCLSQDGRVAGGWSFSFQPHAPGFTWTAAGGRQDLIGPGLPPSTGVASMSSDGAALVGYTQSSQQTPRPYRRVGDGPLEDLGLLPGEQRGYAYGVSGEGSVVVGRGEHTPQGGAYGQAFRWTKGGGMQGLGFLRPGGTYSSASAISRDGSTIVGVSQSDGPFGGPYEAFTWTQATGITGLPTLPGASAPGTSAEAVSADGSVVVGAGYGPNGRRHAVRWVNGVVEDLSAPFGQFNVAAFAVSDTGDVIGGSYGTPANAFVWTPSTTMMPLADYLTAHGVDLPSGYRLEQVYAISGDGLTFGGYARNLATNVREGFVATIPAPCSLMVLLAPCFCCQRRRGGPDALPVNLRRFS